MPGLTRQRRLRLAWILGLSSLWLLVSVVDGALLTDYQFGGLTPYGVLWKFLNPFYWTQIPYRVWLVAFQAAMVALYVKLFLMGKMRFWLIQASIVQNIIWGFIHWQENITVTMFGPLVSLNPVFVLPMILQKLPFPGTDSWACAFGPVYPQVPQCDFRNGTTLFSNLDLHTFTYAALVFWVLMPLALWLRDRMGTCNCDHPKRLHRRCGPCRWSNGWSYCTCRKYADSKSPQGCHP